MFLIYAQKKLRGFRPRNNLCYIHSSMAALYFSASNTAFSMPSFSQTAVWRMGADCS